MRLDVLTAAVEEVVAVLNRNAGTKGIHPERCFHEAVEILFLDVDPMVHLPVDSAYMYHWSLILFIPANRIIL